MGIWDVQIYSHLVRIWLNVQNSIPIYSRITTIHSIGIQFMFPLSLSRYANGFLGSCSLKKNNSERYAGKKHFDPEDTHQDL